MDPSIPNDATPAPQNNTRANTHGEINETTPSTIHVHGEGIIQQEVWLTVSQIRPTAFIWMRLHAHVSTRGQPAMRIWAAHFPALTGDEVEKEEGIICREERDNSSTNEIFVKLPCGHFFGADCLQTWFRSQIGHECCPYCRNRFSDAVRDTGCHLQTRLRPRQGGPHPERFEEIDVVTLGDYFHPSVAVSHAHYVWTKVDRWLQSLHLPDGSSIPVAPLLCDSGHYYDEDSGSFSEPAQPRQAIEAAQVVLESEFSVICDVVNDDNQVVGEAVVLETNSETQHILESEVGDGFPENADAALTEEEMRQLEAQWIQEREVQDFEAYYDQLYGDD